MRLNMKLVMLLASTTMIIGCGNVQERYQEFIEEKAEESTQVSPVVTNDTSDTSSTMPETLDELYATIVSENDLSPDSEIFRLSQPIQHRQNYFDLTVSDMLVSLATSDNPILGLTQENMSGNGAVILIKMSLTNHYDESFYFSGNELKLSYWDSSVTHYPVSGMYAYEQGNLLERLNEPIEPGETVEGYLVYTVTSEDIKAITAIGAFSLAVLPPTLSNDGIVGLSAQSLGNELPFYLPVNQTVEDLLISQSQFIQDRVTAEWWGNKTLLASADLNEVVQDRDVTLTLKRVELSDFIPHEHYQESFQYFPNGVVILSIEIQIDNQSQSTLLPVDSEVAVDINDYHITSDYVLINEHYGEKLSPGESTTLIKTFALDKMTYQLYWQDKPMVFSIWLQTDEQELSDEVESVKYFAEFTYEPVLEWYFNEELERVTLQEQTISETTQTQD